MGLVCFGHTQHKYNPQKHRSLSQGNTECVALGEEKRWHNSLCSSYCAPQKACSRQQHTQDGGQGQGIQPSMPARTLPQCPSATMQSCAIETSLLVYIGLRINKPVTPGPAVACFQEETSRSSRTLVLWNHPNRPCSALAYWGGERRHCYRM